MKIGVIGVQGAVSEHISALNNSLAELGIKGKTLWLRKPENVDAVIIPGGESTTITELMQDSGLWDFVKERALKGMPVLGTCAGLIVISKAGVGSDVEKTGQPFLGLLDCKVNRNFFGRQRESFETELNISFLDSKFKGVFIRAPAIMETFGTVKVVSKIEQGDFKGTIVGAEQGNILGLAFHPELAEDLRVHKYFISKIKQA